MPLFYKNKIDEFGDIVIWKITEDEPFFLEKIYPTNSISNYKKRLQHLAGRYALTQINPQFPFDNVIILDSKKPVLSCKQYHFSISHCKDLAGAIIHQNKNVGIDIELHSEKTLRVRHKFVNEHEDQLLKLLPELFVTVFWSTKETMFKWLNDVGVDFKEDLLIKKVTPLSLSTGTIEVCYNRETQLNGLVHYMHWDNVIMTYTLQEENELLKKAP